jgi:hypothetical protein
MTGSCALFQFMYSMCVVFVALGVGSGVQVLWLLGAP